MKKLIIGLVIGLMLGMSTNAFAAIGDKVQAVFAEFNYVVNGQEKTLDSPVLVYEGVSYVRTTDISNMLGFDVTYKKDSRTIEFNNPDVLEMSVTESTYEPEPTATPTAPPISTPQPTDENGNVIPTPTPDPNATPEPSATPVASTEPTASPVPTATVTPTPSPTPAPSNVAQCQAIRDNYTIQIFNISNSNTNGKEWKIQQLQNARDNELSSAGC